MVSGRRRNLSRLVAALTLAGLLAACEEEVQQEIIRPVEAIRVGEAKEFVEHRFPGQSKATQEVNLSFRVQGPLISLSVAVGSVVETGDVVAQIDPRDYQVALRNVEAQLARANAELDAMREARPEDIRRARAKVDKASAAVKLAGQDLTRLENIKKADPGAVAQAAIDRAVDRKSQSDAALRNALEELRIAETGARKEDIAAKEAEIASIDAAINAAEDALSYSYLQAPFDGTIVATYVENFEDVQAKQPIVRLLDTSKVEMIIDIPEGYISFEPYIDRIEVTFDAFPETVLAAEIVEIGQEATATTRTYPVTLRMDQPKDAQILPGMAGTAKGYLRPPDASLGILLPTNAVTSDQSGKSYVWVLRPQGEPSPGGSSFGEVTAVANKREVTVGKLSPRGIEVKSGVSPGDWIATAGLNVLRDGQMVRLREQRAEAAP